MNYPDSEVRTINFDDVDATNSLLASIGLTQELGPFIAQHLTDVLRKQDPHVVIESVELVRVHDCQLGGILDSDGNLSQMESLRLPLDVNAIVVTNENRHRLDLSIEIKADSSDDGFRIESDVLVRNQAKV